MLKKEEMKCEIVSKEEIGDLGLSDVKVNCGIKNVDNNSIIIDVEP